jgi:dTDP-4-dehydrorhamnose 3,5-epimerase
VKFTTTTLAGVLELEFERLADTRGWFVRVYDEREFAAHGLATSFPEHSESRNVKRGTIRGMHWQSEPYGETKVIRCTRGAAYDVLVDVREGSPTFGRWHAFELRAENAVGLYVPPGVAHGYQTLEDDTELHYLISVPYVAVAARGVAYDSVALAIPWPLPVAAISERDRGLPQFRPDRPLAPGSP